MGPRNPASAANLSARAVRRTVLRVAGHLKRSPEGDPATRRSRIGGRGAKGLRVRTNRCLPPCRSQPPRTRPFAQAPDAARRAIARDRAIARPIDVSRGSSSAVGQIGRAVAPAHAVPWSRRGRPWRTSASGAALGAGRCAAPWRAWRCGWRGRSSSKRARGRAGEAQVMARRMCGSSARGPSARGERVWRVRAARAQSVCSTRAYGEAARRPPGGLRRGGGLFPRHTTSPKRPPCGAARGHRRPGAYAPAPASAARGAPGGSKSGDA